MFPDLSHGVVFVVVLIVLVFLLLIVYVVRFSFREGGVRNSSHHVCVEMTSIRCRRQNFLWGVSVFRQGSGRSCRRLSLSQKLLVWRS